MHRAIAIFALLLSLCLVGCGEDDDDAEQPAAEDAAIVVESPQDGDSVSSPVTISGTASVFEGTVQLRILDAGGEEIASAFTTASAGAPERGEFSEQVEFTVGEPQEGVIEVFEQNVAEVEESPERELNKVSVAVELEP
jgi:Immunoglobulin-like domain of bacterial spore germination